MSWTYKQHEIGDITQFPEKTFGFVYMTTHKPSGKSYIGKKVLFHNQKKKLGKKEIATLTGVVGRRPSYKLVVKESDWLKYYGSQSDIKQLLLEGKKDEFERTILKMCPSKKSLTYFEIKYQMIYQVLEKPDEFFNDNILGKFFTKDLNEIEFEDFVADKIQFRILPHMVNQLLVTLVNSVLGSGKATARNNYAYHCPLCHHHKPKLEVNLTENREGKNPWHCWACDARGTTIYNLFRQVKAAADKFTELKSLVKTSRSIKDTKVVSNVVLPNEYISLNNVNNSNIMARHALAY